MPKARVRPGSIHIERLETRDLLTAITITKGGTYTGLFESFDRSPAIIVETREPVIIENATIRSTGDLIVAGETHINLTVRKSAGYALNPNVAGETAGKFLDLEEFSNVVVEDNYLVGTTGIHLLNYWGNKTSANTIKILRNTVRNIDGRKSDGAGGYLDYNTRFRISDNKREDGYKLVQFVQLNKVNGVPDMEIAWNDVLNEPGKSRVEDNISIFNSSGTKTSPLRIHDNSIFGAYTIKPWQGDTSDATFKYDWSYAGGGIMLGDGGGTVTANDPAFVEAYRNQVMSTTNYGIAIAAGHDNVMYNNRVLSSGKLADGRPIAAQNVGLYIWDSYKLGSTRFYNNRGYDNEAGWMYGSVRNDWWAPGASTFDGNVRIGGVSTITVGMELTERSNWWTRRVAEFSPRGTIAGTVFNDLDLDGVKDSNEAGVGGFTVFIDKDADSVMDSGETRTTTTSTGRYEFKDQVMGVHIVCLNAKSSWRAVSAASASLSLAAGSSVSRYFPVSQRPLISGTVFMDANKDGIQNGLEVGLGGWRVFIDADQDGVFDANEISVLTDLAGRFTLSPLTSGNVQLRVAGNSKYRHTAPSTGYRSLNLSAGQTITNQNFGEKRLT